MRSLFKVTLTVAALAAAMPAFSQVVFYENDGFSGRSFTAERKLENFERAGFNDRASSLVVLRDRWEVCEDARFQGRCVVVRPGRYPSLSSLGLNDRISSVRPVSTTSRVDEGRYAPASPVPVYDNHRRGGEQVFEAEVTSVRAVHGTPQQRCWTETERGTQGGANVPGAVIGGLIGGVLGHQVGSGRGNDAATVGGAVAGAAIGANTGRDNSYGTRDVRRCETAQASGTPDHWDVAYVFRGQEHRIQTAMEPGRTVRVNSRGEPRG